LACPAIFNIIREIGNIDEKRNMFRVFNMGIGMMIIVSDKDCPAVPEYLEFSERKRTRRP
jgi:phosphoribosylformylglycinamidine cyclo-ligase